MDEEIDGVDVGSASGQEPLAFSAYVDEVGGLWLVGTVFTIE